MSGSVIELWLPALTVNVNAIQCMALYIRSRSFLRLDPENDRNILVIIFAVGIIYLLCNTERFDITLSQRDLFSVMIPNLRGKYRSKNTIQRLIKEYNTEKAEFDKSNKEAKLHLFDNVNTRHTLRSRRAPLLRINKDSVFYKLEENLYCLCT